MQKILYKTILFIFAAVLLFDYHLQIALAEEDGLRFEDAKSIVLMEKDTGEIIHSKEAHKKLPPASLTKLMTLLIVMEELENDTLSIDEIVTTSKRAASMGGSQIFLEENEKMTVDDLLKAVAIASANDASVALAEKISGSEEAFVKRMNRKAEELNLKNTNFVNSTGLPKKNHYSSAYDLAIIAKNLLNYENVINYTNIYEDYLRENEKNEFWLVNTNRLVRFHDEVDGLKTGYTKEAQFCLAATAKKNNMRMISVVMGAETSKERNRLTMDLLNYGFDQYETEKIYEKNETVRKLNHYKAQEENINIVTKNPISVIYKKGEKKEKNLKEKILIDDNLKFPLQKNERIGSLQLLENDKVLYETDLIVDEKVNRASFFTLWKRTFSHLVKTY